MKIKNVDMIVWYNNTRTYTHTHTIHFDQYNPQKIFFFKTENKIPFYVRLWSGHNKNRTVDK